MHLRCMTWKAGENDFAPGIQASPDREGPRCAKGRKRGLRGSGSRECWTGLQGAEVFSARTPTPPHPMNCRAQKTWLNILITREAFKIQMLGIVINFLNLNSWEVAPGISVLDAFPGNSNANILWTSVWESLNGISSYALCSLSKSQREERAI